ncbi:hypothetical protein ACN2WE_04785 [Streptomyces sp. cg28]
MGEFLTTGFGTDAGRRAARPTDRIAPDEPGPSSHGSGVTFPVSA